MADKKKSTAKKAGGSNKPNNAAAKKSSTAKATTASNAKKHDAKNTKHVANSKKPQHHDKKHEHKEAEEKHVSEMASETSENTWKSIAIVLIVVAVILLGAIIVMFTTGSSNGENSQGLVDDNDNLGEGVNDDTNTESSATADDDIMVTLTVVEDPTCASCQVDLFTEQVKQNLIPSLESEKISYESDEGKAIIDELEVLQLPTYLFSENINERSDWMELESAFIEVEYDSATYYMLNPQYVPAKVMIEMPVITDTAIVIGDEDAPVTVVEFSDYECPFCAIAEGNEALVEDFSAQAPGYVAPVPKIFEEYVETGQVKFVFYNMPLEVLHPEAEIAHMAALCANEQDMWYDYHRKLFEDRDDWISNSDKASKFKEYAEELGLDTEQFNECLDDEKYAEQIEEELMIGAQYGVSGTPAFLVNRVFLSGAQDFETFKEIIDAELAASE